MELRPIKNLIGLCACKGCLKRLKVKIEVKEAHGEWGVIKTKQKFWICHDCVGKLF